MNQGLIIVLPLIFFFLIDGTLFINSLRQGAHTRTMQLFSRLSGFVMISQGLTALTYACDFGLVSLSVMAQYIANLISLACMTFASYLWFKYLLLTGNGTKKYLSGRWKVIFQIPVGVLIAVGIPSQWTHWLFYIDAAGRYQPGSLYILQFMGFVYYFAAVILSMRQIRKGESMTKVLARFFLYLLPTIVGTIINTRVLRGGYTQIGCSYAVFLLYLEQYITEVNENRKLKNIENMNRNLRDSDSSLLDQMGIISGLTNAYFSAYSVDMETGRCRAIKVIDFFRNVVKNCTNTEIVTKAFILLCVMPEDKEKMRAFTNRKTLADRLQDTDAVVEEFHGCISPWEWCRASWIVAARNEEGKAVHVLFTVEDISEKVRERMQYEKEREQAQRALEASQAAAESANRAKTNFLFNMSHDIRTPMNAIIGYADLLEKHMGDTVRCRDYLNKIKNSSDFLLSLVNNVLEMARIESGKMVLDETICSASKLAEQVTSVYAELMKQKKISFHMDVDVRTPYYYGDRVKLCEIFLNIVSNAYKYTQEGGEISLKVEEAYCKKPGYIRLRSIVTDTGIGMSKEYLPQLFDEFSREHTATENRIQGTGLGMPIVKRLVEFMDGTIEVESEQGKGTTFMVTIPHRIADASEVRQEKTPVIEPQKFTGKRILLVEDNELNMEIATEILSESGFYVDQAGDGLECLNMLERMEDDYYDLILMDVQMPRLDGYGATKQIRAMADRKKATIPIIAMTANAFEEDRQNALAAGMDGHLAKPIEIDRLLETLSTVL